MKKLIALLVAALLVFAGCSGEIVNSLPHGSDNPQDTILHRLLPQPLNINEYINSVSVQVRVIMDNSQSPAYALGDFSGYIIDDITYLESDDILTVFSFMPGIEEFHNSSSEAGQVYAIFEVAEHLNVGVEAINGFQAVVLYPSLPFFAQGDEEIAQAVFSGIVDKQIVAQLEQDITAKDYAAILSTVLQKIPGADIAQFESDVQPALESERALIRAEGMIMTYYAFDAANIAFNSNGINGGELLGDELDDTTGYDLVSLFPTVWNAPGVVEWDVNPPWDYFNAAFLVMATHQTYYYQTLFAYDNEQGSIHPREGLSTRDALKAAYRLLASDERVAVRDSSAPEDAAILAEAEQRRQEILDTETDIEYTGRAYYVSQNGDDTNDGRSPENAWASIGKARSSNTVKAGDAVFFERGGIFRGTLITKPGVTYSAYGTGPKPIITNSPENGTGREKWILLEGTQNIWKFHVDMVQSASIVVNGDILIQRTCAYWDGNEHLEVLDWTVRDGFMEIGAPLDITRIPDNSFFNDIRYAEQDRNKPRLPKEVKGPLYFRCDQGNPGEVYESIEFSAVGSHPTTPSICTIEKDVMLDNIAFLYGGNGLICESGVEVTNAVIQNCEVGYTGGQLSSFNMNIFGDEESRLIQRDGDGILLMGSYNTARNNYIHDTWDHAFTVESIYYEWPEERKQEAKNNLDFKYYHDISILDNVVENCASLSLVVDWSLIQAGDAAKDIGAINEYRDITIKGNYSINNGYHWRSQAYGNSLQAGHRGGVGFAYPYGCGGIAFENNTIYRVNYNSEFANVALFYNNDAEEPAFMNNVLVQDHNGVLLSKTDGTPDLDNAIIVKQSEFNAYRKVAELLKDIDVAVK